METETAQEEAARLRARLAELEGGAPPAGGTPLRVWAEAYAFRALCAHLRWRADVPNLSVMTLAGFCRNCLSKWLHAGAAKAGLAMTYDEACELVYGEPYAAFKKRQPKATQQELDALSASKAGHAKHAEVPTLQPAVAASHAAAGLSDVCCQDADGLAAAACAAPPAGGGKAVAASVAVLTVSDRASAGTYEDASGPEVVRTLDAYAASSGRLAVEVRATKVVPDERAAIEAALVGWAAEGVDLVLTTGGTGCAPRDVTPEATLAVVDRQAPGLPEAVLLHSAAHEPYAALSRAAAGVRGTTLVVNLPGRPKAVREALAVLMPLLPHAVSQARGDA